MRANVFSTVKNKRSPCPHKTSNTLQANNLHKINLEWALSYEWEFYEFVLFCLLPEWMEKHGWINKWMEEKKKKIVKTLCSFHFPLFIHLMDRCLTASFLYNATRVPLIDPRQILAFSILFCAHHSNDTFFCLSKKNF